MNSHSFHMIYDKQFLGAPYQIHIDDDQADLYETGSIDGVANDVVAIQNRNPSNVNHRKQNKTKQSSTQNNSCSKYISTFLC